MQNNPFRPKGLASGPLFFNRKKEREMLESYITNQQHVLILAPRRIGKTSLIENVIDQLKINGYRCVFIDLFKISNLTEFAEKTVTHILKEQTTPIDKLKNLLLKGLPKIAPKLTFSISGEPELGLGVSSPQTTLGTLSEILLWNDKHKKNVIVFDEIQEIISWSQSEVIEKSLRATIQRLKNTTIVFSGSAPSLLKKMFSEKSRAFFQMALEFKLSFTPENEAYDFLYRHFKAFHADHAQELALDITNITRGHPYYVQLLGFIAWNLKKECQSWKSVTLDKILAQVFSLEQNTFEYALANLTPQQKQIFKAIAIDPNQPITSSEFMYKHRLPSHSSVRKAALKLDEKGYLLKTDSGWEVADPLLGLWINS